MEFKTIHTTYSDTDSEAELLAKTVVQHLFDLSETDIHSDIQAENFVFNDTNAYETISFDSYSDIIDFIYDNPNPDGYFYNNLNGERINIHPYFEDEIMLNWIIDLLMDFGVTLVNNLSECSCN